MMTTSFLFSSIPSLSKMWIYSQSYLEMSVSYINMASIISLFSSISYINTASIISLFSSISLQENVILTSDK